MRLMVICDPASWEGSLTSLVLPRQASQAQVHRTVRRARHCRRCITAEDHRIGRDRAGAAAEHAHAADILGVGRVSACCRRTMPGAPPTERPSSTKKARSRFRTRRGRTRWQWPTGQGVRAGDGVISWRAAPLVCHRANYRGPVGARIILLSSEFSGPADQEVCRTVRASR